MKNTTIKYVLKNGKNIELTITFKKLLELKRLDYETYEQFMEVLSKESVDDMFGYVIILYTAYLCANINNVKECVTYQEFIKQITYDYKLIVIASVLTHAKQKNGFRKPFGDKTKRTTQRYKIPKFKLEDIEDYYTYYVMILKISEDIFWNYDYSFILSIVANKIAFEDYIDYVSEKNRKKNT